MKALVTGAAGFIGSHVAEHCLSLGMKVTAVDNLSGGFAENLPEKCTFREGDLTDTSFVDALWKSDGPFDYVYHLAAYAAEGLSHYIRNFNYQTNLIASTNLINASVIHNVSCFVFTSSIAVYGTGRSPLTEDMTPHPEDPYGISKYAVELDLECARTNFGLNYIVFRPHNVYGEKQNVSDRYRNVIGIFMNQCLRGEPMTIFGNGLQTRAFSYIDDVAPIISLSPLRPAAHNEIFNIGADSACSVLELSGLVAQAMGCAPSVLHHEARNEVFEAFSDHSKLRKIFKEATHSTSLADGLSRMAAWVKNSNPRPSVKFSNIEISKNLPKAWL